MKHSFLFTKASILSLIYQYLFREIFFFSTTLERKKEIATKFFIFISREKVLGLKIRQSKRCIPQFFNVSWPFFYKWKQKKNEKEMGRK